MAIAPRDCLNSEQSLPPLLTRVGCNDGITLPTSPSCGLLPIPRGFNSHNQLSLSSVLNPSSTSCLDIHVSIGGKSKSPSSTSCLNIPIFDGNNLGPSSFRSLSIGTFDRNPLLEHTYKKRHSSMNYHRFVHVPGATICNTNKTLGFEQGQGHNFFDRSGRDTKNHKLSCINRQRSNGEFITHGDIVGDFKWRSRRDFKPLDIGNVTKILQNPNVKDVVGSHPFEKVHPVNEALDGNPFNDPLCDVLSMEDASSPPNGIMTGPPTTKDILNHNITILAPVILESKWDEAGFFNSPHPSLLPLPKFCTKQRQTSYQVEVVPPSTQIDPIYATKDLRKILKIRK